MKTLKSERRESPRINQELPLKVAANGYDFSTSTQNISCLGAYCNINKYIPPFTRVMIKLTLPLANGAAVNPCDVECKGVIVRTEDTPAGGFNIAVFFNHIRDEEKKKISQYISQFIPQKSASPQRI